MSNTKLLLALLGGAAAGAALGVLFAPEKGSEMRRNITDTARRITDALLSKAEQLVEEAESQASDIRSDIESR
jgi:gas vesicle protein